MYNMIPNLLWTALFLIPITLFCYRFITPNTTCLVLGISMVPVFFPKSFFDKIQLSRKASFYKKIGVKHINRFAQNGALVNRILKKKYPGFKVVSGSSASVKKQYYQTYFFEKFHFSLFLFFMIVTVYGVIHGQFYWVLMLIVSNLFYNIYPNLLQQYIRVRLKSSVDKQSL